MQQHPRGARAEENQQPDQQAAVQGKKKPVFENITSRHRSIPCFTPEQLTKEPICRRKRQVNHPEADENLAPKSWTRREGRFDQGGQGAPGWAGILQNNPFLLLSQRFP